MGRVPNTDTENRDPGIDFNTETGIGSCQIPVFGYLAKIGPKTTKIDQKWLKNTFSLSSKTVYFGF